MKSLLWTPGDESLPGHLSQCESMTYLLGTSSVQLTGITGELKFFLRKILPALVQRNSVIAEISFAFQTKFENFLVLLGQAFINIDLVSRTE